MMEVSARGAAVAIVEDDLEISELLIETVERMGHEARAAHDGAAALALFDAPEPPRVMILDLSLPIVDGYAVGRAARARLGSALWIIVTTGFGDVVPELPNVRFDDLLFKPFGLAAIEEALQRAFVMTGPAPAIRRARSRT